MYCRGGKSGLTTVQIGPLYGPNIKTKSISYPSDASVVLTDPTTHLPSGIDTPDLLYKWMYLNKGSSGELY